MYSVIVNTQGVSQNEKTTLLFAAQELKKYLKMVIKDEITVFENEGKKSENTIVLGVGLNESVNDVEDVAVDDAIVIDIEDMSGTITGSNARAVLIACYRFLREIGFCFLRPGKFGERIPGEISKTSVSVDEKASCRHRGFVIEGSLYKECLSEFIDWLPKVAMNSYFVQFRTVEFYVNRFYRHPSPCRERKELPADELEVILREAEAEIKKRGIIYHAVGHGWTCDVMGVDGNSWYEYEGEIPEKVKEIAAEMNGVRKFHKNMPLDTNLCYSRADVRDEMVENIADYCEKHPEIDYMHFWLADSQNNNCECEECSKKLPSDFYVQMLNELDEKLTARGLDTKVVFLMYVDLLWWPLYEKFKNSERFVMMFAPISRTFSKAIDPFCKGETVPYVRNKLEMPSKVEDNVEYLRKWQEIFDGDSFNFDYHFWYDLFLEISYVRLAKILHEDIKNLKDIGLKGLLSAGTHRCFLPSVILAHTKAETLWNNDVDFEKLKNKIFIDEFGVNYKLAKEYLEDISVLNCVEALRLEENLFTDKNIEKLNKGISVAEDFAKKAEGIIEEISDPAELHSWKGILFHAKLVQKLFLLYLNANDENMEALKTDVTNFVLKNEEEFKSDFESVVFCERINYTISMVIGEQGKWLQ